MGTAVSDEEDTDARPVGGGCQASIDAQDCDTGSLPVQVMNMFADFSLCSCASRSRWFASWTLSMLSPIVMSMGDHCLSNLKRILSRDPVVRDAVHHSTFREVSLVTVCVHSFELHLLPLRHDAICRTLRARPNKLAMIQCSQGGCARDLSRNRARQGIIGAYFY